MSLIGCAIISLDFRHRLMIDEAWYPGERPSEDAKDSTDCGHRIGTCCRRLSLQIAFPPRDFPRFDFLYLLCLFVSFEERSDGRPMARVRHAGPGAEPRAGRQR